MNNIITSHVQSAYNEFYQTYDKKWRMLGAKYKAQNIVDVCKGHTFHKVLEVGAGDGSILTYLDQWEFAPELHALEIAESGVDMIRARNLKSVKSVQVFDGYKIPFEDDAFDLVILSHVLEHVEFERLILREMKRVSRFQVIEVPKDYRFGMDKRMKHFLAYGHINMYSATSLRYLLQSEGYKILSDKVSMTNPEVTKFNLFINQKHRKSLTLSLKVETEYWLKKIIGALSGKARRETFANAYTVLTQKETDLNIFNE